MAPPSQNTTEDRTEPATPFRREEFRKQGSVAVSRELISVVLLCAVGVSLWLGMANMMANFRQLAERYLVIQRGQTLDKSAILHILSEVLQGWGMLAAPVLVVAFVVGILICVAQVGFYVTWEPLNPNFDRINPVKGFQRIFSSKGSMEGVKAVLKVLLVLAVAYAFLYGQLQLGPDSFGGSTEDVVYRILVSVAQFFFWLLGAFALVAILDYAFQRYQLEKQMRMTKTEAKEEFKLREGDPLVKGRVREVQKKLANQRMMEAVPQADVIVTNPTHFAVAIKYDAETMHAPKVTAKGADFVAKKIKEVARFYDIPIVENKPLARTLYKQIDIGHYIPKELYKAVAEVLAYIYRLRQSLRPEGNLHGGI